MLKIEQIHELRVLGDRRDRAISSGDIQKLRALAAEYRAGGYISNAERLQKYAEHLERIAHVHAKNL